MPRARNIKPGFFKNEILAEQSVVVRLLYIGLWTLADREGRLEDRPKRIKMELFPCDSVDVEQGLDTLAKFGFIDRYEVNGLRVIHVCTFLKHQTPHGTEKDSELPDRDGNITVHERNSNNYVTGVKRSPAGRSDRNNVNPTSNNVSVPLVNSYQTVNQPAPNTLNPDSPNPDSPNHETHSARSPKLPESPGDDEPSQPPPAALVSRVPGKVAPGQVCFAMKRAGLAEVSPSNQKLLSLIEAGAVVEEFTEAAAKAVKAGKGFAYALGIVEGVRRDAKDMAGKILIGALPAAPPMETFRERDERLAAQRVAEFSPSMARKDVLIEQPRSIFSGETIDVPAITSH